jgi:hypothetical protein
LAHGNLCNPSSLSRLEKGAYGAALARIMSKARPVLADIPQIAVGSVVSLRARALHGGRGSADHPAPARLGMMGTRNDGCLMSA